MRTPSLYFWGSLASGSPKYLAKAVVSSKSTSAPGWLGRPSRPKPLFANSFSKATRARSSRPRCGSASTRAQAKELTSFTSKSFP